MEELRNTGLEELRALKEQGKKIVGYFCLYVPVEIIYAAGAVPVRLARGDEASAQQGEEWLRADACPFCKTSAGRFATDPLCQLLDGLVMVNTCDMMRRLADVLEERLSLPLFSLYLPRTAEPHPNRLAEWTEQLRLLQGWVAELTGAAMSGAALVKAVEIYNRLRQRLQELDRLRTQVPARLRAGALFDLIAEVSRELPERAIRGVEEFARYGGAGAAGECGRPRLLLAGSIVVEEDRLLLNLLEERADVVADVVCTGMRWFAGVVSAGEPLTELARFYFNRVPCAFRRPNDALYANIKQLIEERQVQGMVYKTLFYCDPWRFEIKRMRQVSGMPVLEVDGDYSQENREQLRTRIEAFIEVLK